MTISKKTHNEMCSTAHCLVQAGFILLSFGAHILQVSMRFSHTIAERGPENTRRSKLWVQAARIERDWDT